jgi:hypothetical protein
MPSFFVCFSVGILLIISRRTIKGATCNKLFKSCLKRSPLMMTGVEAWLDLMDTSVQSDTFSSGFGFLVDCIIANDDVDRGPLDRYGMVPYKSLLQ